MRTKTILTTIIIVILIALGIWFFMGMAKNNTQQTGTLPGRNDLGSTTSQETIVHYTNNGFSPTPVKIKLGDTVTFINESDGPMWVASNPHPTHTDYPSFDELTSVDAGGVYKFTFDKIGTWGYHNHMNHTQTGTVTVTK